MTTPRVVLLPRRARPFYGRHPWVYAGAIAAVEGEPADGDVVDLVSHTGNFVARGLYNSRSKIRVRLYSWDAGTALDRDFFRDRLAAALRLRTLLGMDGPGRACRLVLDAFCYTGGFGLHAARAGAASVLGVDQSEPALALARANARLNGLADVEYVKADVFDQLGDLAARGERFGLVVLDPPKFA